MSEPHRAKKILFWTITIIAPLVFMELFLRLYFASQVGTDVLFYGVKSSKYQGMFDPGGASIAKEAMNHSVDAYNDFLQGYWKYSPHQHATEHNDRGEVFNVTINSMGFRGGEFTREKRSRTLRVVSLGASSTFGYHDKDNETYPSYLQDTLSQLLLEKGCEEFTSAEVLNLGIPHLESDNIVALFMAEALPLKPDVVTYYEGINDAHVDRAASGPPSQRRGWIRNRISEFYGWLRARFIAIALAGNLHSTLAMRFSEAAIQNHMKGKADHFLQNVSRINDECKKDGILFVVANQQAKSQMIERDKMKGVTYAQEIELIRSKLATDGHVPMGGRDLITHESIMNALRNWASANNVAFVDVIKELDMHRDFLVTWVHLDAEGNQIVASVLAKQILEHVCHQ